MKPSEDLFDLIKSMSKSEKRHFRLNSNTHVIGDKNNYMLLFDAIDKQKAYNEEEIVKKLKNEPFIKHIHVAKNYLYKLILKSLSIYHAELSVEAKIRDVIKSVEVLYMKRLYKQAYKQLKKAVKLASEHEIGPYHLQALEWEDRLEFRLNGIKNMLEVNRKIREATLKYSQYNHSRELTYLSLTYLSQIGISRNLQDKEGLDSIYDRVMDKAGKREGGAFADFFHYLNLSLIERSRRNGDKSIEYSKLSLQIFKENPHLITENPSYYLVGLNNFASSLLLIKDYEQLDGALMELRTYHDEYGIKRSQDTRNRAWFYSYNLDFLASLETANFRKMTEVGEEIKKEHDDRLQDVLHSDRIVFYFNISKGMFLSGEFKKSLYWINCIINDIQADKIRTDIFSVSRLLNLMIHYELQNHFFMMSALKSTKRAFAKKNITYPFESAMLEFFQKEGRSEDWSATKNNLEILLDKLNEVENQPFGKIAQYFDFKGWINAKLKRMEYKDYYLEGLKSEEEPA